MKDNFSKQASLYKKYRPGYPPDLYTFIYSHVLNFNEAWDCATGNGQVATVLASRFNHVEATDISPAQLGEAGNDAKINYSCQPAEKTQFNKNQFNLITVAQALHWFNHNEFYKEVLRVAAKGAIFAAWGYDLLRINPEADKLIDQLYNVELKNYWDPERKIMDDHYSTLDFPGTEFEFPAFEIRCEWDLSVLEGYLYSWSAVQHCLDLNHTDSLPLFMKNIQTVLPAKFTARFAVFGRIARL